ncbi:MAG: hypothetical protein C4K58_05150 [Flavobacteriaceae bacterium]|nr:MAG: hypothetical protein C4K58_05150 [Flavobacteriaceae bacterium]
MKNILSLAFVLISGFASAQLAIGKTDVDGNAILDFKSGTKSGLILPRITLPTAATANKGTLAYDATNKKIVYSNGTTWVDLSAQRKLTGSYTPDASLASLTEVTGAKNILGASNSTADGVLVLEATDKGLILPKIASPELNVMNPRPGMICYDTVKKNMAVYDGSEWTFWSVDNP